MNKIVLIAGPTCSGKSKIALELAQKINGALINADSMQIYKEIPVLSAQPTSDDQSVVPHLLYGHIRSDEDYSVGHWLWQACDAVRQCWAQSKVPIVVGGTGLYFEALTEGLSNIPPTRPFVRVFVRELGRRFGVDVLRDRLRTLRAMGADAADTIDLQRASRALEVRLSTGKSLADWQEEGRTPPFIPEVFVPIVLTPDREIIYRRCDQRLDEMVKNGALEEVFAVSALTSATGRMARKALGLPQFEQYLAGETSLDDALIEAKTATRRYAKRQFTWISRHMISWNNISEQDLEKIRMKIFSIVKENGLTIK